MTNDKDVLGKILALPQPALPANSSTWYVRKVVPELDQQHKKQAISTLLQTKKMKTWKFYKPVSHSFDL